MAQRALERPTLVRELQADVEWGTSYELLLSLSAHRAPELAAAKDVRPPWFLRPSKKLSPRLREAMDRIGVGRGPQWGNLVGLAAEEPPARDVPSLIHKIESAPALEVRLTTMGARSPSFRALVDPSVFAEAAHGSRDAQQQLVDRFSKSKRERAEFRRLLALGVEETKKALLDVLRGWYGEVLRPLEDQVASVLARDAKAKLSLKQRVPSETLIEIATNGVEYRRDPWATRVLLVPQLAWRPWNILNDYQDASIICYPVADESLGVAVDEPPPALVRLHQALGDEKRLRMLRRLAKGSASLQELAAVANLAKSSAHHHLVLLRSAGLVRATTEEHGRYTLRRDAIPGIGTQLEAFLQEEGGS